jgi:hypothetical protein
MENIFLDFYSGSHGHFLEYIINTYIFQGPRLKNIFTPLGTSHLPCLSPEYKTESKVRCGHFSEFNSANRTPDKIIRISILEFMEKICYQLNVHSRAGDIPSDKKIQAAPADILLNPAALRNYHYAKLTGDGYRLPGNWMWNEPAMPVFDFQMKHLYNLTDFYIKLKELAHFLEHSFNPDETLCTVWNQFMSMNQGVQAWNKCQDLLHKVLANESFVFESTAIEQALLNCLLTNTIGVCDGPLFTLAEYPTDTQDIYKEVISYIKTFDSRF